MVPHLLDQRYLLTATKEVIIAAGVIGTPQLLLLSGIGPAAELRAKSITSVVDLADVGKNLVDHPLVPAYYAVDSDQTWDEVLRDGAVFGATLAQWQEKRQGLFVDSPGNVVGYFRLPSDAPILKKGDPSAGSGSAHTEIIFSVSRPSLTLRR